MILTTLAINLQQVGLLSIYDMIMMMMMMIWQMFVYDDPIGSIII